MANTELPPKRRPQNIEARREIVKMLKNVFPAIKRLREHEQELGMPLTPYISRTPINGYPKMRS